MSIEPKQPMYRITCRAEEYYLTAISKSSIEWQKSPSSECKRWQMILASSNFRVLSLSILPQNTNGLHQPHCGVIFLFLDTPEAHYTTDTDHTVNMGSWCYELLSLRHLDHTCISHCNAQEMLGIPVLMITSEVAA
jgi:hypothetical protein